MGSPRACGAWLSGIVQELVELCKNSNFLTFSKSVWTKENNKIPCDKKRDSLKWALNNQLDIKIVGMWRIRMNNIHWIIFIEYGFDLFWRYNCPAEEDGLPRCHHCNRWIGIISMQWIYRRVWVWLKILRCFDIIRIFQTSWEAESANLWGWEIILKVQPGWVKNSLSKK